MAGSTSAPDPAPLRPEPASSWGLPITAAVTGWGSVPLLYLSATSFVVALALAAAALLLGLLAATDHWGGRRSVALLGAGGGLASVALAVVPFLLQD
jgi:hypothetical protein